MSLKLPIRVAVVVAFAVSSIATAQNPAMAQQAGNPLIIIQSQHLRITAPSDIVRIAVGDPKVLSAEPLNTRELLLLGGEVGRTTLLVWSRDGAITEYLCTVQKDLSLLQIALTRIHPFIKAEMAPDRPVIVLTGTVPDASFSVRAENATYGYLDGLVSIQNTLATVAGSIPPASIVTLNGVVRDITKARDKARGDGRGQVLNFIQLTTLPMLKEEIIELAVRSIGGKDIRVRRVVQGKYPGELPDVFVLEGKVPNQVALTRVLSVASGFLPPPSEEDLLGNVRVGDNNSLVLTDEAGAFLTNRSGQGGGSGGSAGGGGTTGSNSSGSRIGGGGGTLSNQVTKNVARAKVISMANGRILSFLEVVDIPQIRVDIRLYEINRNKLKTFSPNTGLLLGTSRGTIATPTPASTVTPSGVQAQTKSLSTELANILGFVGGALVNETQLTSGHFALDTILTYLEQQGIARSLSSPSLTVLNGETAQFQVGGSIPVQEAFSPALNNGTQTNNNGGTALGVFSSVKFLSYGIELNVRPLVGDDDTLTLDVSPQITTPDTNLTANIRQNTGTNQATTAFLTRSLHTSARLQDGQALLIGGLLTRNTSDNIASTPGARDVPGLGWLFKKTNRADDGLELVIVLNPSIIRDPIADVGLWEYPDTRELKSTFGRSLPEYAVPERETDGKRKGRRE